MKRKRYRPLFLLSREPCECEVGTEPSGNFRVTVANNIRSFSAAEFPKPFPVRRNTAAERIEPFYYNFLQVPCGRCLFEADVNEAVFFDAVSARL